MFSKTTKGAEPGETSPGRKIPVASLVAEGVRIRGDLATAGDLHLDGALEGDLVAQRVIIGETGAVIGSIQADHVEVRCRVSGTVSARVVCLRATARVDGDISHGELAIEAARTSKGEA